MSRKDDWKPDKGWRGAGADAARDRTIDELIANGKLGAAARVAWEGGRTREAADWFARAEMYYEAGLCREQLGDPRVAHTLFKRVPLDHKTWRLACAKVIVLGIPLGLFDFDADRIATRFAFAGPLDQREIPAYLALIDHYLAEKFEDAARNVLNRLIGYDPQNAEAQARLGKLRSAATPGTSGAVERKSAPLPALPGLPPLEAIRKPPAPQFPKRSAPTIDDVPRAPSPPSPPSPPSLPTPQSPPNPPPTPVRPSVDMTLGDDPVGSPQGATLADATSLPRGRPGEVINGRYRLDELLGQGGMGVVWRAFDVELGQEIALKILPEPPGSVSWLARIKQELAISRRLTHKNVVRVHDIGTWGTSKVISMELLRGRTLASLLAESGPPPWQHSLEILVQVCSALRAAHDEGVVHRDIKPENIFIGTDGVVKVMDFGIARAGAEDHDAPRVTRAGVIMGTPEYMAPEQIEDAKSAGPRADLYSTGIVMYEIFTGAVPFEGAPIAVLVAQTDRAPVPPRAKVPDLPESIEQTILELLQKSPDARIPSATELARRLRASLRELR